MISGGAEFVVAQSRGRRVPATTSTVVEVASAAPREFGIIVAIKDRLANFKVPKWDYLVDELPRNAIDKVQKNVLRQHYSPMREE